LKKYQYLDQKPNVASQIRFALPGTKESRLSRPAQSCRNSLKFHDRDSTMPKHLDRSGTKKEYYAILGADEEASPREIERLYKRLAHKHHPDRGGTEEEMKTLNEAYQVLRDAGTRRQYDSQRQRPAAVAASASAAPAAREVGTYGQLLSALLCLAAGLMLLLLVRFNGLWFLWPLSILAAGVILFGVLIAHSAMTNLRHSFGATHPARRFRVVQEIAFWSIVFGGCYGIYLVLTTI